MSPPFFDIAHYKQAHGTTQDFVKWIFFIHDFSQDMAGATSHNFQDGWMTDSLAAVTGNKDIRYQ